MLPDRVSNPGPLTYESGAQPIALRRYDETYLMPLGKITAVFCLYHISSFYEARSVTRSLKNRVLFLNMTSVFRSVLANDLL